MLQGLLTRREQGVLIFIVAALLIGGAALWWQHHRPSGITVTHDEAGAIIVPREKGAPRSPAADVAEEAVTARDARSEERLQRGRISINVAGAVGTPGVYKLSAGSIVEDAVLMAGGYADNADPDGINRAAKLIDGTTLTVPGKPTRDADGDVSPVLRIPPPARNIPAYLPGSVPLPSNPPASTGGRVRTSARLVNINSASSEELQTLPRIGPKLADAIIEYRSKRPFMRIEEIQEVTRIGPKTFEGFKHMITVTGE